ncbi:MAG: hypothetical protein CL565_06015 [Alphaproteobacteria bacterium]|nr:hypothetical protein [Alphaproteobacteria bacterium]|tara:strand:+ start:1073 stop:1495 length:423 start_codon:yes stop_codon:yes gene_type:complete
MDHIETILAHEFSEKIKSDGLKENEILLDVRSDYEAKIMSPDCNILHVPLHEIEVSSIRKDIEGKTVYVLCKAGVRAMKAAEILHEAGKNNLIVIEGGLNLCCHSGIPLKGEETSPSPETQERLKEEAQKSVTLFMAQNS